VQPNQNPNSQPFPAPAQPGGGPDYNFIMAPQAPKKRQLIGSGFKTRLLVLFGGLLLLIILFSVVKGLLTTAPFNQNDYMAVIAQQQEINHILTTDLDNGQRQDLSLNNQNFAITSQLAISSAQTQLITYLVDNHKKVDPKKLDVDISSSVDTELTNILSTNNFNPVFDQVMQAQLTTYEQKLMTAYGTTTGPKGRALLKSDYSGAQLLIKQVNSPTS
jgi:hypothetical protein